MTTQQQPIFVFFGKVGAGKGTQIDQLKEYLEYKGYSPLVVYAGDRFRDLVKEGTYTGKRLDEIMRTGDLVPNFLTNAVVTEMLIEQFDGDQPVIFDGYPRSVEQAKVFEDMVSFFEFQDIHLVDIAISDEEAVKRLLKRGRSDDTEEGIRERLGVYENQVFSAQNDLRTNLEISYHHINGEQEPDAVQEEIRNTLNLAS